MKAFWNWMNENRYSAGQTKAHLIGYMMEYLDELQPSWIVRNLEGFHIPNFSMPMSIEDRYNWLESKINDLESPATKEEEGK